MNIKIASFVLVHALLAGSPLLAATTVEWDPSAQLSSYSNGVVTVAYDGSGNVTELTLDPKTAGGLTITGGAMTLSSEGAEIVDASEGSATIANSLQQVGTAEAPAVLSFESTAETTNVFTVAKPTGGDTWTLLIQNMDLSHVTNVTARFDKASGQTTSGLPCDVHHCRICWSPDGTIKQYEFQEYTSGATIRAVAIGLRQYGPDIQVKHQYYAHLVDNKAVIGDEGIGKKSIIFDADGNVLTSKPSEFGSYSWQKPTDGKNPSPGCFVSNLVVYLDAQASSASVALTAGTALQNVDFKVGETTVAAVKIEDKDALPVGGYAASGIEVGPKGVLTLNANMGADPLSGIDHGVPITVRAGGILRYARTYQLNNENSHVILDGGTMWVGNGVMSYEPGNYIHNITFRNGAVVRGESLRVRTTTATWKVEGTSPSFCNTGLSCWNAVSGKTNHTLTFDVADVTGDGQTDFTVAGPWVRPNHLAVGYRQLNIIKTGAGTMQIDGAFTMGYRPLALQGGTFFVNGSLMRTEMTDVTDSKNPKIVQCPQDLSLEGGAFAVAAGSTNVMGVLKVTTGGKLVVGADAALTFADSSAEAWPADALVVVDLDLATSALRFGTDANGLAKQQLKQFRYKSVVGPKWRFSLDADGYLCVMPPPGLVITVR